MTTPISTGRARMRALLGAPEPVSADDEVRRQAVINEVRKRMDVLQTARSHPPSDTETTPQTFLTPAESECVVVPEVDQDWFGSANAPGPSADERFGYVVLGLWRSCSKDKVIDQRDQAEIFALAREQHDGHRRGTARMHCLLPAVTGVAISGFYELAARWCRESAAQASSGDNAAPTTANHTLGWWPWEDAKWLAVDLGSRRGRIIYVKQFIESADNAGDCPNPLIELCRHELLKAANDFEMKQADHQRSVQPPWVTAQLDPLLTAPVTRLLAAPAGAVVRPGLDETQHVASQMEFESAGVLRDFVVEDHFWCAVRRGRTRSRFKSEYSPSPKLTDRQVAVVLTWLKYDRLSAVAQKLCMTEQAVETDIRDISALYEASGRPVSSKATLFARMLQDGHTLVENW